MLFLTTAVTKRQSCASTEGRNGLTTWVLQGRTHLYSRTLTQATVRESGASVHTTPVGNEGASQASSLAERRRPFGGKNALQRPDAVTLRRSSGHLMAGAQQTQIWLKLQAFLGGAAPVISACAASGPGSSSKLMMSCREEMALSGVAVLGGHSSFASSASVVEARFVLPRKGHLISGPISTVSVGPAPWPDGSLSAKSPRKPPG
mmetsp:Transcript_63673/g.176068  ORF Transcript_63673/g.176068 Transcript_63673/m.176068 type:complete len:205 (-) Transcript_63673:347-961(-)